MRSCLIIYNLVNESYHKAMTNPYQQVQFLTSAAKLSQLPADTGMEVAFAGRSNAGKSSTLNALCQQKGLAKTSKTPGRTQLINLFELDDQRRLVDLPGYGYAKVNLAVKKSWQATLSAYLEKRQCLKGLILIMDIRHPLKEYDCATLEWAVEAGLPVHILLNKADKLKCGAAKNVLLDVQKQLPNIDNLTIQLFSATKKIAVDELIQQLNQWYGL